MTTINRIVILVVASTIFFSTNTSAGIIWDHPRDGIFKWQPPSQDPWFYMNINERLHWRSPPEKWSHYMVNYAGMLLLKDKIGITKTILLLSTADLIKEIENGYREGFSIRDTGMNILGITAGLLNKKLICTFDTK